MSSESAPKPAGSDSFVHLHVHTDYSMLDGAARTPELVAKAADLGMPAIAMTDHGNVFGAYDFAKQAKAVGIKPIIGMEAYVTPATSRFDRTRVRWAEGGEDDVSGGGAYTHMTMLSETDDGMRNLFRMASRASLEGFFYKPRVDRELLNTYAKGLIATTGCVGGEVSTWIRIGDYSRALASAAEFRDIFGKDNFFVEVMDHGLPIEKRVLPDLLRIAKDLDLPIVATNDLHYTQPGGRRHPRGAAGDPVRVDPRRSQAVPLRRQGLLPQVAGGDAGAVGRQVPAPRGMRQHPADRRALPHRLRRGREPDAPLPGARRRDRIELVRQGGRARAAPALPGWHHRRGPHPRGLRGRDDPSDGLPRVLPGDGRSDRVVAGARDPGRSRSRIGDRLCWSPMRCGSPSSTRWYTACCSSGS